MTNIVRMVHRGSFRKTRRFLERMSRFEVSKILEKYAMRGVEELRLATPKNSGRTANSWSYSIKRTKNRWTISWMNSNIQDGVPIAVILQYGHGTGNGGYVNGIDYINPALKEVFEKLADEAWEEVTG